jgi:hypothetical protein
VDRESILAFVFHFLECTRNMISWDSFRVAASRNQVIGNPQTNSTERDLCEPLTSSHHRRLGIVNAMSLARCAVSSK